MAGDPTAPRTGTPAALEPAEPSGRASTKARVASARTSSRCGACAEQDRARVRRAVPADRGAGLLRAAVREARRAHDAAANHITDQIKVGGKTRDVVSPGGIPIGPTWHGVLPRGGHQRPRRGGRLLYGGRNSLLIGFVATLITMSSPRPGNVAGLLPRLVGRHTRAASTCSGPIPCSCSAWRWFAGPRRLNLGLFKSRATRCGAGGDHRLHLHPLRGQADPRPGALPARAEFVDAARSLGRATCGSCSARSSRTSRRRSSSSSR